MNHNNCWFVVCSVQSFKRHFSVTIVKPDFQKMVKYQATSCIQGSTGLCYINVSSCSYLCKNAFEEMSKHADPARHAPPMHPI